MGQNKMTLPDSLAKKRDELDHPCKDRCSGWQQGFDRGQDSMQERCEELRQANERLVQHLRCYMSWFHRYVHSSEKDCGFLEESCIESAMSKILTSAEEALAANPAPINEEE